MSDKARELLELFYLPEAIYLREIVGYSAKKKMAIASFLVPFSATYTSVEVEYVGAEQYIRCINQLAYVLCCMLVDNNAVELPRTTLDFLARNNRLLDRAHCLRYRMTAKGVLFRINIRIDKCGVLRDKFLTCKMSVSGPVYGTVEFVAPLNNKG